MTKNPKTFSKPKKGERRKKAIPIRFTKVNVIKTTKAKPKGMKLYFTQNIIFLREH